MPVAAAGDDSVLAWNGGSATTAVVAATNMQDLDGLLRGVRWASLTQSYSFTTSAAQYGSYVHSGLDETLTFQAFNATMQTAARASFEMVNAYTLLNLTENTASPGSATIRLARSDLAQPTAYAYYPSAAIQGGDVWMGTQTASSVNTNPISGNYGWLTHLHEIGHSLGLKHSQDLGGVSNVAVTSAHDAMEYTVMSYRSYVADPLVGGYSNETWGYAQTYMMYDIAALQYMYGADFASAAANVTNSVYTFSTTTGEMFINGVAQGAAGGNRIFRTVWDGGGNDTYDFSNYSTNQTIDLSPGGYSLMSTVQQANLGDGNYAHGNLYNALQYNGDVRSLIENAKGGTGNDLLVGNNADNVLTGGAGTDRINAGSGNDTVSGGAGSDTLNGGSGNDTLAYYLDGAGQGLYVNLLNGVAIDTGGAVDYLAEFENIVGTENPYPGGYWSDFLIGDNGNNAIYGQGGNDYIVGGYGYDTLNGGTGTDWFALVGEIQGGGVYDIISDFNAGGVQDYLNLALAYQSYTSFGDYGGYGYAYINFGGGNTYTVLAAGVTGAQLQASTYFS
jgi:serralysin